MPRAYANTAAAAVRAAVNAGRPPLEPPAHCPLTEAAKVHWAGVINSRARDEWTECDLVIAAQLAQVQADIQQEDSKLRNEGRCIVTHSGSLVANPRASILERLASRQLSYMRALRMGGIPASKVTAVQLAPTRKMERDARDALGQVRQESLLA